MQALLSRLFALSVCVLTAACLGACGEPRPPGGFGRLEPAAKPGGVVLLHLEGSPYEMGWWQGRLLKDRIQRLHKAWEEALFKAFLPAGGEGPATRAVRQRLEQHCDLCLDQTEYRLSEPMLQELDGMAAGSGLERTALLRLDVFRDALRMKGLGARLTGAAGLAVSGGGYHGRAWWSGPDADLLAEEWIVVRRIPHEGQPTLVLTWPGSLGAVAGLRADGLGYLSAEGDVVEARRRGFGGGRPFTVAAREHLAAAESAEDLLALVTGTMGNPMICFSVHTADDVTRVHAMAAFQVYGYPDPPWIPSREGFIAVGPYERMRSPAAVAMREAVHAAGQQSAERWLRVRDHADPSSDAPPRGPELELRWGDEEAQMVVRLPGDQDAPFEVGFDTP